LVTHIDVDKLLGNFDVQGYGKLLLQHINEHKWYLSEQRGVEVQLIDAAKDWYETVFKAVCRVFNHYGLLEFFPDKTASSLYVEIMEHKYFMSKRERKDVGLVAAVEDYLNRFAVHERFKGAIGSVVRSLRALFRGAGHSTQSIYPA
jgi:hypothetical protein